MKVITRVNNTMLYEAIASVYRAASTEATRPTINSVLLKIKNNTLITVATDGHMLAKWETEIGEIGDVEFEVSLKLNTVKDLVNMLKKDKKTYKNASVIITDVSEKDIQFKGQGFCITCEKAYGAFPPYEKVIPIYDASVTSGPFLVDGYYLSIIYKCFKETLGKQFALEFKVRDSLSPILIAYKNDKNESPLSVVLMPMRV